MTQAEQLTECPWARSTRPIFETNPSREGLPMYAPVFQDAALVCLINQLVLLALSTRTETKHHNTSFKQSVDQLI